MKFTANMFTQYVFETPTEEQRARILPDLNKKLIQNEISSYAEKILSPDGDVLNTQGIAYERAFNTGAISALRFLLALSNDAEQEQLQQMQEAIQASQQY